MPEPWSHTTRRETCLKQTCTESVTGRKRRGNARRLRCLQIYSTEQLMSREMMKMALKRRLVIVTGATAMLVVGPLSAAAYAQEVSIRDVAAAVDSVWIVIAAILVMFMQAGFALVEAGFTRAKNAGNIIMKNVMDFSLGGITYWAFGFALAYGGSSVGGFVAYGDVFFFDDPARAGEWFFQVVFAATAATIISGAIAGRMKFTSYLLFTPLVTGIMYPIVTHWVWGGGWLAEIGFFDFAGSGVVHMLGGAAALAGVIVIGPRIGKYDEFGTSRSIPGHSVTLAALGVFILWFGWYGFNAGSTLTLGNPNAVALIVINTTLAAASGAILAMLVAWVKFGKPDVTIAFNGVLAGLVGITASCNIVTPLAAIAIGAIAGIVVVLGLLLLDRLRVDDPVGAISVHGLCGIWGTLAVGLMGLKSLGAPSDGLLVGGGIHMLGVQALGVTTSLAFVAVTMWVVFKLID
ncbi:MAG: ammonium transporter, partial [Acidobacteria bacterium]